MDPCVDPVDVFLDTKRGGGGGFYRLKRPVIFCAILEVIRAVAGWNAAGGEDRTLQNPSAKQLPLALAQGVLGIWRGHFVIGIFR